MYSRYNAKDVKFESKTGDKKESGKLGKMNLEEALIAIEENKETRINLSRKGIGDEGAKAIAEGLKENTALTHLE